MTERRIRVAFVDDEANVLSGLRRSMLAMLDQWEMGFFNSGEDLLRAMAADRFDVVVSDMRMPQMDGATLLQAVNRDYPETVRVILSGYADSESVLRTVGPAHIYLAKPCDPGVLRQAIQGRLALRSLLNGKEMRRLLGGLSSLPSAPQLFLQVVAELRSPRASTASIADLIDRDVAMTAELLKLTNSSYFAVNAKVSSPLQAVRILGLEIVQTLVLQHGIFRQFGGGGIQSEQINAVNDYSHALGTLTERIAQAAGMTDEIVKAARCAALLSAIGSLILLHEREEDYRTALAEVDADKPLHEAETQQFGADHALIGAYLLSLWGFSDPMVEAVGFAATPGQCARRDNPILAALHVARALGPSFPLLPDRDIPALPFDLDYLTAAGHAAHIDEWQQLAIAARIQTTSMPNRG